MTEMMKQAVWAMQLAVDEEMERKAKLGYNAVIADKHGNPKIVSAKYLVRKRRAQIAAEKAAAEKTAAEKDATNQPARS